MKKILILFISAMLYSCDDGDLQIETINFDDSNIQFCGSQATTSTSLLFKINGEEALLLTLKEGMLKNEASQGEIAYPISGDTKVTYRIFSDKLTKNYFCDAIPPIAPTVVEEIVAQKGTVYITTTQKTEGETTSYEHLIRLGDITLLNNSNDQRITDLRINNFGTVSTK
ncbi:hypothetical protein SAMN04487911_14715 [Arenibacter nanhaiticus]|uniref:Lipoprotein n=1 Tax=Arenibacter nanhaiticus TaxID=558155 RepID=A0A1M6MTG1_9FLAO|nr:hypothetical protein [Arenibacter nanhaiticus]SHJ86669.1 hypothetical protein SAMN04487911_14715 [Arenibacter nanhaiticus]